MCVECCWCLCIHKVSFRGASYFFASVHSYQGVSRLLDLVFKNVLLRTYFMDHQKTDLEMPQAHEDPIELLSRSLYYLTTTICALLIFRGIEKEWRHLIKWAATIFFLIEGFAFAMYFVLYPNFYESASSILTLSSRVIFVLFYLISLYLYSRQIGRDEDDVGPAGEWEWEPKFLSASPGGILNGGFNLGLGTLGFGENTSKWLENKEHTLKSQHHQHGLDVTSHYANDKLELPRYEVCKSSSKM